MKRIISVWLPDLHLVAADSMAERARLDRLADGCLCYTPWVAADGWNEGCRGAGLWLDITGSAHLWGGEEKLLAALLARLRRLGFAARLGAADTPGAAWAWARFGAAGCLPPGGQRDALAGLPVPALRLLPATVDGLVRVGLKLVGDLYPLPRAALTARFGRAVGHRLDQALGQQDEPISPCRPPVDHRVHLAFAEPIARPEDVTAAARSLVDRLGGDLAHRRLGVRRLDLTAFRLDATLQRLSIGTNRPSRDPRHLFRLLAEPLKGIDAGFGIEMLRLEASEVAPLGPRQLDLGGAGEDGEGVARLLDSLGNRLGFDRVSRFVPRQSHLPERAVRRIGLACPDADFLLVILSRRRRISLFRRDPSSLRSSG